MKKRLTQIFCLLMAFQVLFASMGFTVIEHLCKVKGKKTFIVSTPKKCCSDKKRATSSLKLQHFKKTKCCEEHTTVHKVITDSSNGYNPELQTPAFFWLDKPVSNFTLSSWENESVSFRIPHFYDAAPPLSGKNLLIRIRTFLI
ncbi:HYC_CC_PP family protein [Emticicia sp. BO119]|uniref:HYC_CC_PP family protein n=1 Tax=Emticicia sp. BO119 TaxID=2757768 RepID=UPI0015EFFB4E|nr:hypothetical protein [Emticicia sp. BO119]MBA4853433.1 hypothetical protein [Emticicia sp. BO119]